MVALPELGPLRIGSVDLPLGKVVASLRNAGRTSRPVAWVTVDPVQAAGHVWQQLSGLHHETGLAPILLRTRGDLPFGRPWDNDEFDDPVDPAEVEDVDVAGLVHRYAVGQAV